MSSVKMLRSGCLVALATLWYAPTLSAQTGQEFVAPTVGTCFRYEETSAQGKRAADACVVQVEPTRLSFDSGEVWELPSLNVVKDPRRSYQWQAGLFSSVPGCWPVGAACGGSGRLAEIDLPADGRVVVETSRGKVEYPKFRLTTRFVDCTVLGKAERCLRSEVRALDRLANGNTHDVRAFRLIALTGEARGAIVESEYVQSPGNWQSSSRLIEVTTKQAQPRAASAPEAMEFACPEPGTRIGFAAGGFAIFRERDGFYCRYERSRSGQVELVDNYALLHPITEAGRRDPAIAKVIDPIRAERIWPLAVGKRHEGTAILNGQSFTLVYSVVAQETLQTPMGPENTFVVRLAEASSGPYRANATWWISPKYRFALKYEDWDSFRGSRGFQVTEVTAPATGK